MPTIPELPAASATTDESELAVIYKNGTTYKAVLADILALRQRANAILDSLSGLGAGVGFLQKTGPTSFVTTYIPGAGAYDPLGTAQAINDAHNLNASAHAAAGFAKLGAIQTFTEEQTFSKHVWISLGVTSDYSWMVANGTINNYFQAQTKNLSNAANASSDHVCTADTGTETLRYIDMGINNSGYTGGVMGAALDGYLYTSDDNLNLGAIAASKVVRVLAGGSNVATNTVLSIASTGVTEYGSLRVVATQADTTQDAIVVAGRAGGTGSYASTFIPTTLSANQTVTVPNETFTIPSPAAAQTWTAAHTFRAANSVRAEAASTQDAIVLAGRAGGTSSYAVTITPTTLTASRTLTLPDVNVTLPSTFVSLAAANTWTASQTIRATSALRVETAAARDAIVLSGNFSGTSSYAATIYPGFLSGNISITLPAITTTLAGIDVASTWTAAQTIEAGGGLTVREAATQDTVILKGRAGGTSSNTVTIIPPTLGGNITTTLPSITGQLACFNATQTWTAAQTFRATTPIRVEAAVSQDAILLSGRAGGTSSYAVTLIPATLAANVSQTLIAGSGNIPLVVAVPATAASTGVIGQIAFDATYAYFCYAVNTWRRVAIATW